MDLLCGTCGHHNVPDRKFCVACNSYLGPDSIRVPSVDEDVQPAGDDPLAEDDADLVAGVDEVICPRCTTVNGPRQRFCSKCGQVLSETATASAVVGRTAAAQATAPRARSAARPLSTVSCPRCST